MQTEPKYISESNYSPDSAYEFPAPWAGSVVPDLYIVKLPTADAPGSGRE
jgi:hypothetical protein